MELLAVGGIALDPWQELVLRASLGERRPGEWAAFEVGLCCPRQNGKNEILLARQLVGLFLIKERLIIHAAHLFDTSLEAFERLKEVVENTPAFHRRLAKNGVVNTNGKEGLKLKGNQRIRFRTRTKGGGRGFTADCLILDEAMEIPSKAHGALLPTLSARPNPQVWYAGSAVDQYVHEEGVVFARVRERGIEGTDPALAYFEWSPDFANPEVVGEGAENPEVWAQANPALGIRISPEHVAREQRSMDSRTFAVERMNVGDWPRTDGQEDQMIPSETWAAISDRDSRVADPVVFALDVSPDRRFASISIAGRRKDGLGHVELVDRRKGTGWIAERLEELTDKWETAGVFCDEKGQAASLIPDLEDRDIEVTTLNTKEITEACGTFFDGAEEGAHYLGLDPSERPEEVPVKAFVHLDQDELNAAVKGATSRPVRDAWAWSRRHSSIDITSLVAGTIAHFKSLRASAGSVYEERGVIVV